MEFDALTQLSCLPNEIASNFNEIWIIGQLRLSPFHRRKNRQNPLRSNWENGLQKVGRNFVFKKHDDF